MESPVPRQDRSTRESVDKQRSRDCSGLAFEKKLATVVGKKTRGNVLGAANFKVGAAIGCDCQFLAGTPLKAGA